MSVAVATRVASNNTVTGNDFKDTRRITEDDPDYQRLHNATVARLQRSLRQYARELLQGEPGADTRFIHRHINLIKQAYEAAHREGQRDYWPAVSNRAVRHRYIVPDSEQVQKRLAFYALGSVLKMAHEVKTYVAQQKSGTLSDAVAYGQTIKLFNPNHDAKGRFDFGSGGKFAAPGSTGGAEGARVQRLLAPSPYTAAGEALRRSVANDLAARLKDNAAFQALAAAAGRTPEDISFRMVDGWFGARSTGLVGAMQLAARDEFGLENTSRNFSQVPLKSAELYAAHPAAYRAFVRAQYDSTQEMFGREGITHITVYRGLGRNATAFPSTVRFDGASHEMDITMRPLSSFSVRESLAASYARNEEGRGVIISADVPVSRILSTPITGIGFEDQGEVVVLGGIQSVTYTTNTGW